MKSTHGGDTNLTDLLDTLRQAEAPVEAPLRVETAVLAAWDRAHAQHSRALARNLWRQAAAVAAAVVIAIGLGKLGRELQRTTRPVTAPFDESGTLLVVGEPILQGEQVRVVRMRVPTSTLTGLGVRPAIGDVAHVDVDVIVGEDGVARAIRVGM
jgi:anti-sigma-K factor RskA